MALQATPEVVAAISDTEVLRQVDSHLELLRLLWGAERDGHDGATYAGVNHALGFVAVENGHTSRGKSLCRKAAADGWVTLTRTGWGRGAKTIVRLTDMARGVCARLFEGETTHGRD